jgi:hypothetical protein
MEFVDLLSFAFIFHDGKRAGLKRIAKALVASAKANTN